MSFSRSLIAEKYDRQYGDRVLVRRIVAYFRSQARRLAFVSVAVIILSVSGAAQPVMVSYGVDLLKSTGATWEYILIPTAVLVLAVIMWMANWVSRSLTTRAIHDVILKLRTDAFSAATRHDLSFYDELSSGRIVSRITSDTQDFGKLVDLVTDLVAQFTEAIILAVVLVR